MKIVIDVISQPISEAGVRRVSGFVTLSACVMGFGFSALAQNPGNPPAQKGAPPSANDNPPSRDGRPNFNGPPPFFPGGGPGGGGGPPQKIKLVEKFDLDGDHRLNAEERKAARAFLLKETAGRRGGQRGPGGLGGPGGPGGKVEPAAPGPKLTPADVKAFPDAPLFDPGVIRTLFFEFEDSDWEKQLAEFKNTDVELPVKLTVDGKTYRDVGVHFRGMSSFMMVPEGSKRSLSVSLDFAHNDQRLGGYRTLNLLNSHEDPSFLRTVLYCQIARDYIPAPRANFVRVVINGEIWGVYVNAQHFDKDFIKDWFKTTKGARWKVPGSPGGRGGLNYLGDDPAAYKRIYEIKSKDDEKSWASLIRLCKVLNQTPPDKLEAALAPLLDVDATLKFLALDNAFINNDGFWIRSSDYSIYLDEKGRFHIIPHDTNETFSIPGGPGFGGGPGMGGRPPGGGQPGFPGGAPTGGRPAAGQGGGFTGGQGRGPRINGVELDPLIGANEAAKPLLSKLLAVPALRTRYLGYVHEMSEKWLDWKTLGPIAQQYHDLISADVKADTRKLESFADFTASLTGASKVPEPGLRGPPPSISLKNFADQRRAYLLKQP